MMGQQQDPQAPSVRQPKRWPLVQQFYSRSPDTPLLQDSRLVNAYTEQDPTDGLYWVFKRVGIAPAPLYPQTGYPGGTYYYQFQNIVLTIVSGNLYVNGTLIGSLINSSNQFWFETVNSNPQTIVIMDGINGWIYTPTTATLLKITDVNFPAAACPGWAYLDGTLYVMDHTGGIHGTDGLDNAVVWDALNLIKASSKADRGVFLSTQLTYVIAFKQWTTQIFYDASNPTGSPLGPVPDAQIAYGCLSPFTVQKIDEILLWVTSNQSISPQVVLMENLGVQIISTPSVERLLSKVIMPVRSPLPGDSVSYMYGFSFKHTGHKFYGLTVVALNLTLVYDLTEKFWYIWLDAFGNWWPMTNFTYVAPTGISEGMLLAQAAKGSPPPGLPGITISQGSLYPVDGSDVYTNDVGQLFPVDIYTPNFTDNTPRRKTLNMMYFAGDQTSGSTVQARYTDDDYKSWSNFRSIDMSDVRPSLDQEGTFTKRAYHFRHMCNTRFRIKSTSIQFDLGTI